MFKIIGIILVTIHIFLALWAIGGVLEMLLPKVFWKPFTNPDFPQWVLIIHWGSILIASLGFLLGYFNRWCHTPMIMTVAYILMAIVCIIETFGYMSSNSKYIAMVSEFLAYIIILIILYNNRFIELHFE